jgi:hypothetical protein
MAAVLAPHPPHPLMAEVSAPPPPPPPMARFSPPTASIPGAGGGAWIRVQPGGVRDELRLPPVHGRGRHLQHGRLPPGPGQPAHQGVDRQGETSLAKLPHL